MLQLTDRTWLWFAAACYLAGFVLGTIAVIRERKLSRALMYFIIASGFTVQTFGLYLRGLEVKGCPLGNTFELFQFTAWSAIALYLVIGATFRLSLLGYFTSVLAVSLSVLSLSFPSWDPEIRVSIFGGNAWIEFHAALALFSYGVFALLTLTAVMYLLQVFSLKRHHLHGLFSFLPSIRELDHIMLRLLSAGVLLLTASLAVGMVYWLQDLSSVNALKLSVTVGVWVAYALLLLLRIRQILLGKRLSWTLLVLFIVVLLSLPLVNRHPAPAADAPTASAR
jgi:HemX protein